MSLMCAFFQYHCILCTNGDAAHPMAALLREATKNSTGEEPHLYAVNLISQIIAKQIVLIKNAIEEEERKEQEEQTEQEKGKGKQNEGQQTSNEKEPGTISSSSSSSSSEKDQLAKEKLRKEKMELKYVHYSSVVDKVCEPFRSFSAPSMSTVLKDKSPQALSTYCKLLKDALYHMSPIPLDFLFAERSFEQMFTQISMNGASFFPKTPFEEYSEKWARGFKPEEGKNDMSSLGHIFVVFLTCSVYSILPFLLLFCRNILYIHMIVVYLGNRGNC